MSHAVEEIYNKAFEYLKNLHPVDPQVFYFYYIHKPLSEESFTIRFPSNKDRDFLIVKHVVGENPINLYRIFKNGRILIEDKEEDNGEVFYRAPLIEECHEIITEIYQQMFDKPPPALSFKEMDRMVGDMNPFNHDHFRMGQAINNDWTIMYSSIDKNELILVNTVNGRRFNIDVSFARVN